MPQSWGQLRDQELLSFFRRPLRRMVGRQLRPWHRQSRVSGPRTSIPTAFRPVFLPKAVRMRQSFVTYTGTGITTKGGNGSGITALSRGGTITINSSGPITTTDGSNAIGSPCVRRDAKLQHGPKFDLVPGFWVVD